MPAELSAKVMGPILLWSSKLSCPVPQPYSKAVISLESGTFERIASAIFQARY